MISTEKKKHRRKEEHLKTDTEFYADHEYVYHMEPPTNISRHGKRNIKLNMMWV